MANPLKFPAVDLFLGDILIANASGELANSGYYKTYYVDGNAGVNTNSGLSWDQAYKTLAVAMAASHASIAASSKGWAARNRIFFKADASAETLTKFAQKTDIIGVGSMDWRSKACLQGNHTISDAVSYMGCRFINVEFKGPTATGGDIITMTSQHGIQFIGCSFRGNSTTAATAAIIATACVDLKVLGCEFTGAYSDAVIELGAGQADGFHVEDCFIQGANVGIDIPATVTYAANKCGLIKNNVISSTLECIKDALGTTFVINNRLRTAANKGTAMAGCIVCGLTYAQDNRCTTGDANNVVYPAQGTI
jgi:hypothetical protein